MRYFNTHGPVNEIEHYVVTRSELISDLVAQTSKQHNTRSLLQKLVAQTASLCIRSDKISI